MVHKYLFIIEQGKISVVGYDNQSKTFSYETNKGEKEFAIQADFWDWWIKAASFVATKDQVDFCFIYDQKPSIVSHSFERVEKSSWKLYQIENFFKETQIYSKVLLKGEKEEWERKIDLGNIEFSSNLEYVFYTTLDLMKEDTDKAKNEYDSSMEEDKITPLAQYFIGLMEQEQ